MYDPRRRSRRTAIPMLLALGALPPLWSARPAQAASGEATTNLVDDTGLLTVDVPAAWSDVTTTPTVLDDGSTVAQIVASPDAEGLVNGFTAPGVIYSQTPYSDDSASALVSVFDFSESCTDAGSEPYSDGYFRGTQQTWTECAGTASRIVTVFASPFDRGFSIALLVQLPTPADDPALDTVLSSFYVVEPTTTWLEDDTGTLTVAVPVSWSAVDTGAVTTGGSPGLAAGTDLGQFGSAPGVWYDTRAHTTDLAGVLDSQSFPNCAATAPVDYDDGFFTGLRQDLDCGPMRIVLIAANASGRTDFTAHLAIATVAGDDTTLAIVLDTFNFVALAGGEPSPDAPGGQGTAAPDQTTAPTTPMSTIVLEPMTTAVGPATTVAVGPVTTAVGPATTAVGPVTVPAVTSTVATAGSPTTALVDASGLLAVTVPSTWTYQDPTAHATIDPTYVAARLVAAESPQFWDGWGISGIIITAFDADDDLTGFLSLNQPEGCTAGTVEPFDNGFFRGVQQRFTGCGGTDTVVLVTADPPDGRFSALVQLYVRDGDPTSIDGVLASLTATAVAPTYSLTTEDGRLRVAVPAWWSSWDTVPDADSEGALVQQIWTSTAGEEVSDNFLYFSEFPYSTPESLAAANDRSTRCTDGGTTPFAGSTLAGIQRLWTACDGNPESQIVQVFAAPADQSIAVVAYLHLGHADAEAAGIILGSLEVLPAAAS